MEHITGCLRNGTQIIMTHTAYNHRVLSLLTVKPLENKGPKWGTVHTLNIGFGLASSRQILSSRCSSCFQIAKFVAEHKDQSEQQGLKMTLCALVLQHCVSCSSFNCTGSLCQGMHNKGGI